MFVWKNLEAVLLEFVSKKRKLNNKKNFNENIYILESKILFSYILSWNNNELNSVMINKMNSNK